MDDTITQKGGNTDTAAPSQMSSTIWIQSDQLDVIQGYLAKPDQPGVPSPANAFVFAVDPRRRGDG